jgi:hypothetical protein
MRCMLVWRQLKQGTGKRNGLGSIIAPRYHACNSKTVWQAPIRPKSGLGAGSQRGPDPLAGEPGDPYQSGDFLPIKRLFQELYIKNRRRQISQLLELQFAQISF